MVAAIAALGVAAAAIACSPTDVCGCTPPPRLIEGLQPGRALLHVGDTVRIVVFSPWFDPADLRVRWSSSAEDVAPVDPDGLVTARSEGEATIRITVETDGLPAENDSAFITVFPPRP